jgi:hypothetical protein
MGRRKENLSPNWTGRIVPLANRPVYELQQSVNALNGKLREEQSLGSEDELAQERRIKETPQRFRELVQAWQLSGPDLFQFSHDHRIKWADVARYWEEGRRLNPLLLLGAPGGGAGLGMNNRPEIDPYKEALRLFIELLLNPACDKLSGPCPRCRNYYICRSARNKVYCSRSCGTRATALAATRKRREQEHVSKLLRATVAAGEWSTTRTSKEWKTWVSRRHPEITVRFLTRAVNNGQLESPTKGQKK